MVDQLTDEQRQVLREQFVEAYAEEQKSYDASVRTLAAGGVAVTVSVATALKTITTAGRWSVGLFLVALLLNIGSYATSQLDMRARLTYLGAARNDKINGTRWTIATRVLNSAAGFAVVVAAILLAIYVARATDGR